MKTIWTCIALILIFASICWTQELSAEDIIAKHLDSIGTKISREKIKNLTAVGFSEFESKNPAVRGGGRAVVVSEANNLLFAMGFNSKDYPYEKIGYFRSKVSIPYVNAGKRSLLGSFLIEHNNILSEGLFAGVISRRWPFLNVEKRLPKLKNQGTKKYNGRDAYVLSYVPDRGNSSELIIRLYFDAATFQHVRSEYRREIPAGKITFGQQNQIASSILVLTEHFSDFKENGGLTLPYAYSADFVSNSGNSLVETIWRINVDEYRLDQNLSEDFFSFDPVVSRQ